MGCVLPQAPPRRLSCAHKSNRDLTLSAVNSMSASVARMYVSSCDTRIRLRAHVGVPRGWVCSSEDALLMERMMSEDDCRDSWYCVGKAGGTFIA